MLDEKFDSSSHLILKGIWARPGNFPGFARANRIYFARTISAAGLIHLPVDENHLISLVSDVEFKGTIF